MAVEIWEAGEGRIWRAGVALLDRGEALSRVVVAKIALEAVERADAAIQFSTVAILADVDCDVVAVDFRPTGLVAIVIAEAHVAGTVDPSSISCIFQRDVFSVGSAHVASGAE